MEPKHPQGKSGNVIWKLAKRMALADYVPLLSSIICRYMHRSIIFFPRCLQLSMLMRTRGGRKVPERQDTNTTHLIVLATPPIHQRFIVEVSRLSIPTGQWCFPSASPPTISRKGNDPLYEKLLQCQHHKDLPHDFLHICICTICTLYLIGSLDYIEMANELDSNSNELEIIQMYHSHGKRKVGHRLNIPH